MIIPVATALFTLVISSCATKSTPTTRISKSPEIFQKLSPSDQELAQQGQVKEGMEKNAVLIAWGQPSKISTGSREGVGFEKWYYATATPVYSSNLSIGYGGHRGFGRRGFGRRGGGRFGYGGYGGFGGFGYGGYGLGARTTYVKSINASVEFDSSGRVTDWKQTK